MRLLRFRLRTLMISIAFLALILTVIMQAILLQRAAVREAHLRAEAAFQMSRAVLQRVQAEAALKRALAMEEEQRQSPPAAPKP
jgi:hypothetical protein